MTRPPEEAAVGEMQEHRDRQKTDKMEPSPHFLPRAISRELLQSELAVLAGGVDKQNNLVVVFPSSTHAQLSTQYAFGDHLQVLLTYLIDLAIASRATRKRLRGGHLPEELDSRAMRKWLENSHSGRFTLLVDQRSLNHAALSVIVRTLSNIQREMNCIEVLYVVRPREKKELKTAQRLLGLGKQRSGGGEQQAELALNFPAVLLLEWREVQRYIDRSQLPKVQGGYFPYSHTDFINFIVRLEDFREKSITCFQRFDAVFERLKSYQQQTQKSLSGLRRSAHTVSKHFQSIVHELRLEELVNECDAYHDDLTNPEKEHLFSQIPRAILCPSAINEISESQKQLHLIHAEVDAVWRKIVKGLGSRGAPVDLRADNKRGGIELLSWLKTVGVETLEESRRKAEDMRETPGTVQQFVSQVVPCIAEAVDLVEEWLRFDEPQDETERELHAELRAELDAFNKAFHIVQNTYTGHQLFYSSVKTAMRWYQSMLARFPPALLDKEGRPDGKKTRVYVRLSDNQQHDMYNIRHNFQPLDPAVMGAVEDHMVFIADSGLRNQARVLLQRCRILARLIDIYGQEPGVARGLVAGRSVSQDGGSLPPPTRPYEQLSEVGSLYEALPEDSVMLSNGWGRPTVTPAAPESVPERRRRSADSRQQPSHHRRYMSSTELYGGGSQLLPSPVRAGHKGPNDTLRELDMFIGDSVYNGDPVYSPRMHFSAPPHQTNYAGSPGKDLPASPGPGDNNPPATSTHPSAPIAMRTGRDDRTELRASPATNTSYKYLPPTAEHAPHPSPQRLLLHTPDKEQTSGKSGGGAALSTDRSCALEVALRQPRRDWLPAAAHPPPPPVDPWDDMEGVRDRRVLLALSQQLVGETLRRVDEQAALEAERARLLDLEVAEERLRRVAIQRAIARTQRVIEDRQRVRRERQVTRLLQQRLRQSLAQELPTNEQQSGGESAPDAQQGASSEESEHQPAAAATQGDDGGEGTGAAEEPATATAASPEAAGEGGDEAAECDVTRAAVQQPQEAGGAEQGEEPVASQPVDGEGRKSNTTPAENE